MMNSLLASSQTQTTPSPLIENPVWSALDDIAQVDWLILHFNQCFAYENVVLVRGDDEPEYFPAHAQQPARIQFAHGFFSSALHEISHWCIAGRHRRTLPDLGYWYNPDGRTAEQQQLFEQVEVKPQAVEWLLSRASLQPFRVSLDNLTGEAGNETTFKDRVYAQVQQFFAEPQTVPRDARIFIDYLCQQLRNGQALNQAEFQRHDLDKYWSNLH